MLCTVNGCNKPVRMTKNRWYRKYCNTCEHLLHKYGINTVDRDRMLEKQNHQCQLCYSNIKVIQGRGTSKHSAVIDHCHSTGKVRGILCGQCNVAIGHFYDNIEVMQRAINYLKCTN